jgi:Transposase DDE domain
VGAGQGHARQGQVSPIALECQHDLHATIGLALNGRRIASEAPVFADIRHHKRMSRFTLRGKAKVSTQWQLYCLVHNIEKIATQAMRAH